MNFYHPYYMSHRYFRLTPKFGKKEMFMTKDQHEIQRKLRIPLHAKKIVSVVKTCRYFVNTGSATKYSFDLIKLAVNKNSG